MKKQTLSTLVIAGCICMLQSCAFRPCTNIDVNLAGAHSRIVGNSDSWGGALSLIMFMVKSVFSPVSC